MHDDDSQRWPETAGGGRHGRGRQGLKNVGLVIFSILLVIGGLELALRFTPYRYLLTRDQFTRYYYQADQHKGFDIAPNVPRMRVSVDNRLDFDLWSNDLGCFDASYRGENPYILLVGDSFTHSYAPFPDKWGTRMQDLLRCRVVKGGVSGYGTKQELLKAKELIARIGVKPRLIVVGYFWNDLGDDYTFPNLTVVDGFLIVSTKYLDPQSHLPDMSKVNRQYSWGEKLEGSGYPLTVSQMIRYQVARHSILMNLVNDALLRLEAGSSGDFSKYFIAFQDQPWIQEAWQRHFANLKGFKELAAANGARLLIVLIPTNGQVYPFLAAPGIDLTKPNRILHAFFEKEGIDYLDLLPLFQQYADVRPRPALDPDKDLYWRHNSHFSLKGEHLAGLLVSRYILAHHLLEVPEESGKLARIEAQIKSFH